MTVVVAAETAVLALLALIVAGLLRSHAEILVRIAALEERRGSADNLSLDPSIPPVAADRSTAAAIDVLGTNLRGEPVQVGFRAGGENTLLAFLSSGCETCEGFWRAFRKQNLQLPGHTKLAIVTKDTEVESPSRLLKLAPAAARVVMSSAAWSAYDVPTSPYFVLIDGTSARIAGEGAAATWEQLQQLMEDAILDAGMQTTPARPDAPRSGVDRRTSDSHPARILEADHSLMAAGIGPDHPSLWPSASGKSGDDQR